MIDLAPMKGIRVDPASQTALVQPGVLLGELDQETQALGLATTLGTAPDTGIAGLTLGGGMGRLMRQFGLACDNLRSVDIVTADGKLLHASGTENPDLLWGVRGGGGNFGIVTAFEYQLHVVGPAVLAGARVFPFSEARSVLSAVVEANERAPDELGLVAALINVTNPAGGMPPGRYAVVEAFYSGSASDGLRHLEPLRKLGQPVFDNLSVKPYVVAQRGPTGASPPPLSAGMSSYVKSGFVRRFPDALIDELVRGVEQAPPWLEQVGVGPLGGAVGRVPPGATAFWNRDAEYDVLIGGGWTDRSQDEQNVKAGRALWKSIEPFTKGYYINTDTPDDERRLRETYGENYVRLVQLKNRYDPTNLFRLNANIKPA
jgi:FAD/FMN-containing dehydrogenase